MDCIQAIESFSQDHAHRTSRPQVTNHHGHSSIYMLCLMYQEVSRKKAQIESIEMIRTWPIDHKKSQLRKVSKNRANIQLVKLLGLVPENPIV